MKLNRISWTHCIAGAGLLVPTLLLAGAEGPAGPSPEPASVPPARRIPGVTAPDQFPTGCVDCHLYYPQMNLDVRISTLMAGWTNQVNSALLSRIRPLMPEGSRLNGQHPALSAADLQDIPAACVKCHAESTTQTASLGPMMHVIHLGGVRDGHFLSIFQGECTHCHKLDMSTGNWRMPSGPERPKASQQAKGQAAIVVYRPGPREVAEKGTFDLVVFPFLVILFTGAAVVLYLGIIAWGHDAWKNEMRSQEA